MSIGGVLICIRSQENNELMALGVEAFAGHGDRECDN
jgi:hypothetical protein